MNIKRQISLDIVLSSTISNFFHILHSHSKQVKGEYISVQNVRTKEHCHQYARSLFNKFMFSLHTLLTFLYEGHEEK